MRRNSLWGHAAVLENTRIAFASKYLHGCQVMESALVYRCALPVAPLWESKLTRCYRHEYRLCGTFLGSFVPDPHCIESSEICG